MATLSITSLDVTEPDLGGINETVRVYSAVLDGRAIPVKWVTAVPATGAADTANRTDFKTELTAVGYTWAAEA